MSDRIERWTVAEGNALFNGAYIPIDIVVRLLNEAEWELQAESKRIQDLESDVQRLVAERDALAKALGYARAAISSPDIPYAPGKDIYDTHMMMGALRRIDVSLDREAT